MIVVDYRSGSRDLLEMPALDGYAVEGDLTNAEGKPVGDVMLSGHGPNGSTITIGVELKSVSDLLTSIASGRLGGTQLPRMLKHWDYTWILYFGAYRCGSNFTFQVRRWRKGKQVWESFRIGRQPVPYAYLRGALLTYQLKGGVINDHVYDLSEAACWLRTLDHWLEKDWDKHRGLDVFDKSRQLSAPPDADPVEEQMAKVAAQFAGIDWMKGWAAAKHFDSVIQMVCANPLEWQKVKGIGPVIARSTHEMITRRKPRGRG